MKRDNFNRAFLFLFGIVLVMSVISATGEGVLTNTTLNDSKLSGATYEAYASLTVCASSCYVGNVTFELIWYNGTIVNTTVVANDTGNDSTYRVIYDTTLFRDTNNITLNLTTRPYTGAGINSSNATAGLDVDNGNPSASISTDSFTDVTNGYNAYASTVFTFGTSADNSIGLNRCSIYFTNIINNTVYSSTASVSSNACSNSTMTPSSVGLIKEQPYNVLAEVVDGNGNRTNSSARRINYLDSSSSGGGSAGSVEDAERVTQNIINGRPAGEGAGFLASISSGLKEFWNFLTFWTDKY